MEILHNHLGFERRGSKRAVLKAPPGLVANFLLCATDGEVVHRGSLFDVGRVDNWRGGGWYFYVLDFSAFEVAGRYRLRATKPGHADAEIGVTIARFGYESLKADHEKEHYKASFVLRLRDVTEKRKVVPVTVLVEGPQGEPIASAKRTLRQVRKSPEVRESGTVQLSSTAKARDRALRVVPDSTLVLVLDGLTFRYPIPLPPEEKMGQSDEETLKRARGRGR